MKKYYGLLGALFIGTIILAKTPTEKQRTERPTITPTPQPEIPRRKMSEYFKQDLHAAKNALEKAIKAQEEDNVAAIKDNAQEADKALHLILNKFE